MTLNLDTLRKIAEAEETQKWGGWAFEEDDFDGFCIYINDGDNFGRSYVAKDLTQGESEGESTAEFIATFDPPTVLALLTRLEQAEEAVARVREGWDEYKSKLGAQIPEYYRRNIDGALTGHWMTAGGTPTGEFADVCSCGKSYWPCTALDGDGRE